MSLTKLIESLPEELNRLVWEFDGRYKKAMTESMAFFVSSTFRRSIFYCVKQDITNDLFGWVHQYGFAAYMKEINIRKEKYKKRMDLRTGHIAGITDQHRKPGPIKRFQFSDVIGNYIILCNKKHHARQELIYQGRLFHSVNMYPVLQTEERHVRYDRYDRKYSVQLIDKIQKCGIEVLDKKWLRKANRRKSAKEFIQHHMSL